MLIEGKAANILCEWLDLQDKTKFGDAQKIHANPCDFCKGCAMTGMSAAILESHLTNMHLNKIWTKTVSVFVTAVSHLIWKSQGSNTRCPCGQPLHQKFERNFLQAQGYGYSHPDNANPRCCAIKMLGNKDCTSHTRITCTIFISCFPLHRGAQKSAAATLSVRTNFSINGRSFNLVKFFLFFLISHSLLLATMH